MIFGNCNIKIQGLYPRLDKDSMGGYHFSVGIKKEFAKKCYERELTDKIHDRFQKIGRNMFEKTYGPHDLFNGPPYDFFKNSNGNLTCLISNLTVPGDRCGLDVNCMINIEKELKEVNKYQAFIEYHPHNIDSPTQCYELLSLLTSWEEAMDTQFWNID